MSHRTLVGVAVVALAIALGVSGILAWVLADPQHWFPDAYAQRGDQGPRGPRGPQGFQGPAGPVGPDASQAIDDLSSRVDDLETSLSDLSDHSGGTTLEDDVDQVQADLSTLQDTVDGICAQFSYADSGILSDAYYEAC